MRKKHIKSRIIKVSCFVMSIVAFVSVILHAFYKPSVVYFITFMIAFGYIAFQVNRRNYDD